MNMNSSAWKADLRAGIVVSLVALPLCLGIALASGAPLMSGIVSGVIGGLVVGALSGSSTSVSGPAAGLTAVVVAQVASLGSFEAFLIAVVLAGVIQVVMSFLGVGYIAAFFPSSVVKGLLAAIGILLIIKQIPHISGHDLDPIGSMQFLVPGGGTTFTELGAAIDCQHGETVVGLLSLLVLLIWDRSRLNKSSIPSPLAVVAIGILLTRLLRAFGGEWAISGSHLVQVPETANPLALFGTLAAPDLTQLTNPAVYGAALTIALVASLETLLNLEAVDRLDPQKRVSPPDRELFAQGVGNVVTGFLGGLPITAVVVRGSANIQAGARTWRATFFHGILLLLSILLVPSLLNQIPLAALAAILLVTGGKLSSPAVFRKMWNAGPSQFTPFIATIIGILLSDLLVGVGLGLAVSLLFLLRSSFQVPIHRIQEHHLSGDVMRVQLPTQVSFLNRAALLRVFQSLPDAGKVVIDARSTDYIDPDVLDLIQDFRDEVAPARRVSVNMVGFEERHDLRDQIQHVDVSTRDARSSATPNRVLRFLQEGNDRFVRGERLSRDMVRQVEFTAEGQFPLAVVLSCMDSRTSAELVFDLGLGDILSIRVAGNVLVPEVMASIEYGILVAGAKLLVVLGHTRCGAIQATLDQGAAGRSDPAPATACLHLDSITSFIGRSVEKERARVAPGIAEIGDRVARTNVLTTLEEIRSQGTTLREVMARGEVALAGAVYDVRTGRVDFLESGLLDLKNPPFHGRASRRARECLSIQKVA